MWQEHIINAHTFLRFVKSDLKIHTRNQLEGWKRDLRTGKQEKKLHALGIGYSELRYKGDACAVISLAEEREKKRLASPIEMRDLYEMGFRDVDEFSGEKARFYIRHRIYSHDEFCALFTFDDGKKITETSYEDAVKRFQTLKEKGAKNIQFKML